MNLFIRTSASDKIIMRSYYEAKQDNKKFTDKQFLTNLSKIYVIFVTLLNQPYQLYFFVQIQITSHIVGYKNLKLPEISQTKSKHLIKFTK